MPAEVTLTQRHSGRVILGRACYVAGFVALSHSLSWRWLQWITSECVLRLSDLFGMPASRVSFDTLRINGQLFEYVTSCTFIDVFMGAIPLIWDPSRSTRANARVLTFWAAGLFTFNTLRLVLAQWLFAWGYSWTTCDQVLGGVSYFLVWLVLWHRRSCQLFPAQAGNFRTASQPLDLGAYEYKELRRYVANVQKMQTRVSHS